MDNFTFQNKFGVAGKAIAGFLKIETWIILLTTVLAVVSTIYYFNEGYLVAYGDAESHLNIAKRVIHSMTPGFAQLGGIWLPLPHMLLIPFVYFDYLWKTGLAGSIVSGIAFVISSLYLYKLAYLLTKNKLASFFTSLVFIVNPNILYLQATPMTELTLIVFFVMSSYYFILFLQDDRKIINLLFAAFFGFCASLSRYDGWALVMMEAGVLFLYYFPYKIKVKNFFKKLFSARLRSTIIEKNTTNLGPSTWSRLEGRLVIFSTLALFGILIWLAWGGLILGDPLYFTHSEFSAKSQQNSWYERGELPAYKNIFVSIMYYTVNSAQTVGFLVTVVAVLGIISFVRSRDDIQKGLILLILLVPYIFNVLTLYLGQSVIFIPGLTPSSFEWTLFNVRYGTMMVPIIAIFVGYLFYKSKEVGKFIIAGILAVQCLLFFMGFSQVLSLEDGRVGLSSFIAKIPDAQYWFERNYDGGVLLTDDFARTISIVRLPVKMQDVIYIGNKPYWEESLLEPEKYATWIVMQKNDTIWQSMIDKPEIEDRLYAYFNKAYTSDEILIFKRIKDN